MGFGLGGGPGVGGGGGQRFPLSGVRRGEFPVPWTLKAFSIYEVDNQASTVRIEIKVIHIQRVIIPR